MSLFTSNFKRIWQERIIWTIPVLIVFILLIHFYAPKTDEKRVIENNSFWKKKSFDKKKYNMVIAGDSRIYRGVSPYAMKTVLPNLTIINFGYGSAGFGDIMLQEIDKKIDYKADTAFVVLGITPLSLTQEGFNNFHLVYELKTKREELIELLYFKKLMQFFTPITLEQIDNKFKGKEFSTTFHQDYTPSGWVATIEDKPWPIAALKSYSTRFINNQVTQKNINQLMTQVKLWKESGVTVIGFRPPTTKKMISLEDSVSGYKEDVIKKQFISAGGYWLEFNIDNYTTYDGSHLQKQSAIRFSEDLANKIKIFTLQIE